MPHWKSMFKNANYISGVELEGKKPTMTIARVTQVDLEQEDESKKGVGVVWFREIKRGWVLCKTTGFCLEAMFGADTNGWSGKRVTLHAEPVSTPEGMQPGIRVTGSPDLAKPINARIKLRKKKAFVIKLMPTGKGAPTDVLSNDAPPETTAPADEVKHAPSCAINADGPCTCKEDE
jgi:hypothetical protein